MRAIGPESEIRWVCLGQFSDHPTPSSPRKKSSANRARGTGENSSWKAAQWSAAWKFRGKPACSALVFIAFDPCCRPSEGPAVIGEWRNRFDLMAHVAGVCPARLYVGAAEGVCGGRVVFWGFSAVLEGAVAAEGLDGMFVWGCGDGDGGHSVTAFLSVRFALLCLLSNSLISSNRCGNLFIMYASSPQATR